MNSSEITGNNTIPLTRQHDQTMLILSALVLVGSFILTLFLIVALIRTPARRLTLVNQLIIFGRLLSLALLAYPIILMISTINRTEVTCFCTSLVFLFYFLLLAEKINMTSIAIARYVHVFHPNFFQKWMSKAALFHVLWFFGLVTASFTLISLAKETPPIYLKCLNPNFNTQKTILLFYFAFFIMAVHSFIIDIYCYINILNYMRKNSVQVMVVASTDDERMKVKNIVTAPASFLIWMIAMLGTLPSYILQLNFNDDWSQFDFDTLVSFQLLAVFVLGTLVPILYIGSSAQLRADVLAVRRMLCGCCLSDDGNATVHDVGIEYYNETSLGADQRRSNVYTIEVPNEG